MNRPAVGRHLFASLGDDVVAHDGGDTQPVIIKDVFAAGRPGRTMSGVAAPGGNSRLIPPERERQKLVRVGEALKAFDGDEAVRLLKLDLGCARDPSSRGCAAG